MAADRLAKAYQNPKYKNIFAVGIAFAPPHAISKPMTSPKGTPIFPAPPRAGMPAGVMARPVAFNIVDMMQGNSTVPTRQASPAKMGAAGIASAGANFRNGAAVSMAMYAIAPDFQTDPDTGRQLHYTSGEIGLAGHWIKRLPALCFHLQSQGQSILADGAGIILSRDSPSHK